jgi:hypothetical protein
MAVKERGSGKRSPAAAKPTPPRERRASSGQATSSRSTATPSSRDASPPTDVWQARVGTDFGAKLLEDAEVLGLTTKTDIVKAALELLHRQAAELRMARGVKEFYQGGAVPLPAGVVPLDESELDDDPGA